MQHDNRLKPGPGPYGAADPRSDDAVVTCVLGGDTPAYEIILRRYNQRLYRVARSILGDANLAEDAVQEAYIRAYSNLRAYKADGTFGAWLTRIAINEALMIKRTRDRRQESPDADLLNRVSVDADADANPAHYTATRQLRDLIESAIDELPEEFRLVYVMRGVQQMSIEETAACLDIPAATVKTRYHRALGRMRKSLTPTMQEVGSEAFAFAGERCDRIAAAVMARLLSGHRLGPNTS